MINDEARDGVAAGGEGQERVAVDDAGEAGDGLPHEERPLLPVVAEEGGGRHAAQKRGHRGIIAEDAPRGMRYIGAACASSSSPRP